MLLFVGTKGAKLLVRSRHIGNSTVNFGVASDEAQRASLRNELTDQVLVNAVVSTRVRRDEVI
jgi:precorrin-4 methylase